MQIGEDIYNISKELRNIIHKDMDWQAHHIQVLLADELDRCKGKGGEAINEHIKILYETYWDSYQKPPQPMIIDKEKQKESIVQDKEVFLYKPYNILAKHHL